MELTLAPSWRPLALRGVVGFLFGAATFLWPRLTVTVLVLMFAIYALMDGLLAILTAVDAGPRADRWWMLTVEGLLGIGMGVVLLVFRGITSVGMVYVIAGWAIATGLVELAAARRLRDELPGDLFLAIGSAASIVLGLLMLAWPHAGAVVLVIFFSAYALAFGAAMVALAIKIRDIASGQRSF